VLLSSVGNDNLHLLTSSGRNKLRIDLGDWDGSKVHADYDDFKVASAQEQYKLLSIGNYSGNAGSRLCFENVEPMFM